VKMEAIRPSGAPAVSSYSPAVLAEGERILFISGQVPADTGADVETQVRQVFKRIAAVLEEAGGDFRNVVMMRGYFVNMARDLDTFRRVRVEFLREPYPASTLVGVSALAVEGVQIEVEAVAVL